MKLFEVTIKPISGFGTPLKGDTLFGRFCWEVVHDPSLLNGGLDKWTACYGERPFAVFSSAWPVFRDAKTRYAMKRPDLPLHVLFRGGLPAGIEQAHALKKRKAKRWMIVGGDLSLTLNKVEFLSDEELAKAVHFALTPETRKSMRRVLQDRLFAHFPQPHNTINRLTLRTGSGMFAPFTETSTFYYPQTELAVFVLLDEEATDITRVLVGMKRIGQWGFGKDASIGHGRFGLGEHKEVPVPKVSSSNACYALSPVVPETGVFSKCFFTPFVRFGKHGDVLARSSNPFKNPVVMADEGAVLATENPLVFEKPYVGRAVSNTSKAMPGTLFQGYTIYLPFRLET